MEQDEHSEQSAPGIRYPDPGVSHVSPYPTLAPTFYGAFPTGPTVHEGYIPRASHDSAHGGPIAGPASEYGSLAARFHMTHGNPSQGRNWLFQRGDTIDFERGAQSATDNVLIASNGVYFGNLADMDPDYQLAAEDTGTDDEGSLGSDVAEDAAISGPARRGAARGRGRSQGRGSGRGRRGWKWALAGTSHERKPVRSERPRGRPRGSGAGRGGRAKKTVDPGRDFKVSLAKATDAMLEEDLETALTFAREAVKANPEVHAAHVLLSIILAKQGRASDSVAALLSGANTSKDPVTWINAAESVFDLAGGMEQASEAELSVALECYTKALKHDPRGLHERHYEARVRKRDIWAQMGYLSKSRLESKNMLQKRPHDLENVRYYAWCCDQAEDVSERSRAKDAYERAFEHYAETDGLDDPEQQWSHLNVYLDIVHKLGTPRLGIDQLRRLARWFLGRKDETFWDGYHSDDREFDSSHARRNYVGEFQQGRASRDLAKYGDGLPIELRVKLGLFRLQLGHMGLTEALDHFDHLLSLASQAGDYDDLFRHVAQALNDQRYYDYALRFYEPLVKAVPDALTDDFWMTLGECYRNAGRKEDAGECYKTIIANYNNHIQARIELARVYEETSRREEAMRVADEIIALGRKDVVRREKLPTRPPKAAGPKQRLRREVEPAHAEEELSEGSSTREPTSKPVSKRPRLRGPERTEFSIELITPERSRPSVDEGRPSLSFEAEGEEVPLLCKTPLPRPGRPRGKPKRSTFEKYRIDESRVRYIQDQDARVQANYENLQALWSLIHHEEQEEAIRQWMQCARSMHDDFRSMKIFYPNRDTHNKLGAFKGYSLMHRSGEGRLVTAMEALRDQQREQEYGSAAAFHGKNPAAPDKSMPRDFHSIAFTEWHRVFVDLALLHAKQADRERCYDILRNGCLQCNVFFHDQELKNISHAALVCCALMFNDGETLCYSAREYISESDMRSGMSYQLLSAVNRLSYGDSSWYSAGPTQKFMLRAVKFLDYPLIPPHIREQFDWSLQKNRLDARVEEYGKGELDPGLLLFYGHITAVANHSFTALPYYFRAYALQPENICVNLSISIMFIQNAMKRQTSNRQYGVAQGLSFLYRYYDLRVASGKAIDLQEAEFNVARMWHLLGLTHLAMPGYEKVLGLSERVRAEGEGDLADYAMEAAFALQSIYAGAGNDEAARAISEEWLVL